ncbi:hypothetical protein OBBRIDRAFT_137968 [Obba rivulosa]|uniref:Uncharacterized protein n=1 Tax=Obba rivulosa TaxID=1052685 RepID=A0A8E2AT60_9APHY|nr:hypothetical protein OBBRIDRAFT_137968 [Obba rivulosa]
MFRILWITVEIAIRVLFVLSDIVILLITFVKTYAVRRDSKQHNIRAPFSALLLHNGTVHLLWMLLGHTANSVAYAFNQSWGSMFSISSIFLNPGMAIAISRFHLTLRNMTYKLDDIVDPQFMSFVQIGPEDSEQTSSHISSLRFTSGNSESKEHLDGHSDSGESDEGRRTHDSNVEDDDASLDSVEMERLCTDADDEPEHAKARISGESRSSFRT